MKKIIKLDLHTHPIEALKEKMGIKGISDIKKEVISNIVGAIQSAGLDGIAITERNNFNPGWVVSLELTEQFRNKDLIILPGTEIDYQGQQLLNVYIPPWCRRRMPFFKNKEWFSILAHPGFNHPIDIQSLMEVGFDAVEGSSVLGEFSLAETISRQKNVPIIKASDARKLEDIGLNYTEFEIE